MLRYRLAAAAFVLVLVGVDMKPSDHIPQIRFVLNDADGVRWTNDELLGWFNDCLDVMVDLRQDLFGATADHTCSDGAEQTLSQLRQVRFTGVLSSTAGSVTHVNKADMDQFNPSWVNGARGVAINWAPHEVHPLKFYVVPPAEPGNVIKVGFVQKHARLTSLSDSINLPENYGPAIQAFVINRANMKDDEAVNTGRGNAFMQDFMGMIGALNVASGA